jgi:hypothetical protein
MRVVLLVKLFNGKLSDLIVLCALIVGFADCDGFIFGCKLYDLRFMMNYSCFFLWGGL